MADISEIKLPDGTTYNIKDGYTRSQLSGKQNTLVSGTNIKTVNGKSILGRGNLIIPVQKDYAQNDSEAGDYIDHRPGGYDYGLYAYEDLVYDDICLERNSSDCYYIGEEAISSTDEIYKMAEDGGYIIPCHYSPDDGVFAGTSVNGTITYEENGDGLTLNTAEGDDSTVVSVIKITPADIPGGILEEDVYLFPKKFPLKYLPPILFDKGVGANSARQKGSDLAVFGDNAIAEGTSSTDATERGITPSSTDAAIIAEWNSSDPEDDKFTLVKGIAAHAEGNNGLALGDHSHVEGNGCIAGNNSSHAEGTGSKAEGSYSHAEGLETIAVGTRSHTEGNATVAYNKEGHAEGINTTAGIDPTGISTYSSSTTYYAEDQVIYSGHLYTAVKDGFTNKTPSGSSSYWRREEAQHAEGKGTTASVRGSHAEGISTQAVNLAAHAEGSSSIASGTVSHAEGNGTTASGENSHAEGLETTASGPYASHAEGEATVASGEDSHAEGWRCEATGQFTHAEGTDTNAIGISSHAEGYGSKTDDIGAHAEGIHGYTVKLKRTSSKTFTNQSSGVTVHVGDLDVETNGRVTEVSGTTIKFSKDIFSSGTKNRVLTFADPTNNTTSGAFGKASHAEGKCTLANAEATHAEGYFTKVDSATSGRTVTGAHAEGYETFAGEWAAHAEGFNCQVNGSASSNTLTPDTDEYNGQMGHAEGNATLAKGNASHAEGVKTFTQNIGEHAEGTYNKSNSNTIHSVGIGDADNNRKNAFEIMRNGDIYALGLGGYTGGNPGSSGSMQQVIDAKYVKPSAGIPESDLSAGVRDFMMKHVIEEKEYDYTCTAATQEEGYIFFGNVVPTSADPGNAWYIRYRMYIDLESEDASISQNNKYCHGAYECRVGVSGATLLYDVFNQMYSTSYRPLYSHLVASYADSTEGGVTVTWQSKYENRATNPVKIGIRIQSAYAGTQPRHYHIELIETYNCSFTFLNAFETYGAVYTSAKYGVCSAISGENGLQESGDANDTTTMQLTYSLITAGTGGIKMYSIIMQDANGNWQSLTTTSGTGVSKTVNSTGFRLGSKLYYVYRNTDIAANSRIGTSQLRTNNALIDLRYSLNINTTSGHIGNLVPYKPLYIVGSINATDGLFYLDTPLWWTQDEPSTENGKIYIKVCEAIYNDYANDRCYRGDFFGDGQMFWYKNGAFRTYEATALQSVKTINNQSMAGSGNINLCSSNINGGLAIVVVNSESEVGTDANTLYIVRA